MAITICCPCGSPIECDNHELLISVECPRCGKELNLELDESLTGKRALLTIVEGPYWRGEQFLVPVGQPLQIGANAGNWLCLEGTTVSDVHCRVQLAPNGAITVEDQKSDSGTWIGEQRISRGRLAPRGALKIGEFVLRFDLAGADGTRIPAIASARSQPALPTMSDVRRSMTIGSLAYRERFILSRFLLIAFAWLGGVYHAASLHTHVKLYMPWNNAIVVGLLFMAAVSVVSRRVTLQHARLKYLSLTVLALLAVVDTVLNLPGGAIAALLLMCALITLIMRDPAPGLAVFGSILGIAGGITIAICAWQSLSPIL